MENWKGLLLREFTIPFLLNNINLLRSDKKGELLKMIAGIGNSFLDNKIINTSNYFNNYYNKEFSITNTNTDFDKATKVIDIFASSGLKNSFLYKFIEIDSLEIGQKDTFDNSLDDYDQQFSEYSQDQKQEFNKVKLKNGQEYIVNVDTQEVTDFRNEIIKDDTLKNEVLVNYYSNANELRSGFMEKNRYFILGDNENAKVINSNFTNASLSKDDRKTLIQKSLEHKIKC
jgi:hypothetical protein